jgi:hypothetical protein
MLYLSSILPIYLDGQSPHLRTPNPWFNPGFTPLLYNNCGGETRVNPEVWCPEMWALIRYIRFHTSLLEVYSDAVPQERKNESAHASNNFL